MRTALDKSVIKTLNAYANKKLKMKRKRDEPCRNITQLNTKLAAAPVKETDAVQRPRGHLRPP